MFHGTMITRETQTFIFGGYDPYYIEGLPKPSFFIVLGLPQGWMIMGEMSFPQQKGVVPKEVPPLELVNPHSNSRCRFNLQAGSKLSGSRVKHPDVLPRS